MESKSGNDCLDNTLLNLQNTIKNVKIVLLETLACNVINRFPLGFQIKLESKVISHSNGFKQNTCC